MKTVFLTCLISTLFSSAVLAQHDFAYRLNAEIQTAGAQSLEDLTWQQGITPLMRIDVTRRGQAIAASSDTKVRMIIGPSSTGTYYAQVTNSVATNTYYLLQWPTVGTNSVGTNGTTDAWWYTVYFEENGHRYWTGNGRLYIEETTSTAEDGLVWQEFISGYTSSITNYTYHAFDPAVEYTDLTGTTIAAARVWTKLDIGEHTQTNADLLFLDLQYSSPPGDAHYAWISGDGTNEQHIFNKSLSSFPFSWRVIVAPLSKSALYYFRQSTSWTLPPGPGTITLHGYWQQDVVSSAGGGAGTGSVDVVARSWIAAVSNTADTALSTATGAAATAASAYTAATAAQSTADAAATTGGLAYAWADNIYTAETPISMLTTSLSVGAYSHAYAHGSLAGGAGWDRKTDTIRTNVIYSPFSLAWGSGIYMDGTGQNTGQWNYALGAELDLFQNAGAFNVLLGNNHEVIASNAFSSGFNVLIGGGHRFNNAANSYALGSHHTVGYTDQYKRVYGSFIFGMEPGYVTNSDSVLFTTTNAAFTNLNVTLGDSSFHIGQETIYQRGRLLFGADGQLSSNRITNTTASIAAAQAAASAALPSSYWASAKSTTNYVSLTDDQTILGSKNFTAPELVLNAKLSAQSNIVLSTLSGASSIESQPIRFTVRKAGNPSTRPLDVDQDGNLRYNTNTIVGSDGNIPLTRLTNALGAGYTPPAWNGANFTNLPGGTGGDTFATNMLESLANVDAVAAPTTDDALIWNGTSWSNAPVGGTGTWNETNYIVQSQIHIANLGTYTVTRASGAGAYIDLTNAAQAINFDADTVSTAGKFGWALDYLGTNALTLVVTNTGAVVQPTALSLTNGAGVILFVKPQGSQTIRAYQ